MNELAIVDPEALSTVVVALADTGRAISLVDALSHRGFEVASSAGIVEIAGTVDGDRPFVAIVDNADPGWLRAVSDLLQAAPRARVLALVDIGSSAELVLAVSIGVRGFVSPTIDGAALSRTVRAMLGGEVAIPRPFVAALVDEVRRGGARSVETAAGSIAVTDREWQILQLLLQRRSTREIAEQLFVSVGTVRTHISALGRKLGVDDRESTIRLLEQHIR